MLSRIGKRQAMRGISFLLVLSVVLTSFGGYAPAARAADPIDPAETGLKPLRECDPGSVIQFGGYSWILLNNTGGLLLKQYAYEAARPFDTGVEYQNEEFNPSTSGNIGYLLNENFLNTFPQSDRTRIRQRSWNAGSQRDTTFYTLPAKVGLLSIDQASEYRDILKEYPLYLMDEASDPSSAPYGETGADPLSWWTATWYSADEINTDAFLLGLSGNYYVSNTGANGAIVQTVETDYTACHYSRPAIYLSPNTPVMSSGSLITVVEPQNDISDFSVTGQIDDSTVINTIDHTITFTMPSGTAIDQLSPVITIPSGADITPDPNIGQDFSDSVSYIVTSADGIEQEWTVTCRLTGSPIAYTVEHYRQNLANDEYTLVASDTAYDYPGITVNASPREYEGFSVNTDLSISSGTLTEIASLVLKLFYDRDLFNLDYVENGGSAVPDVSSIRYGTVINRPADPTREWYRLTGWCTDQLLNNVYDFSRPVTNDLTLYAKWENIKYAVTYMEPGGAIIGSEEINAGTVFGPPVEPSKPGYSFMEWYLDQSLETEYGFDQQLIGNMTLYASFKRNGTDILGFTALDQTDMHIDPTAHTVEFRVLYGTDVTSLAPQLSLSPGADVSPASGEEQDFTYPVTYTVTSESDETQDWAVTCIVDPNTANSITSFYVNGQTPNTSSVIDNENYTVSFRVPYGTDVTGLVPQLTLSPQATVTPASGTAANFTYPVTYTVKSGSNAEQEWIITCVVDRNTAHEITGFTVEEETEGTESIINEEHHSITFRVPFGTDVTGLKPSLALSPQASVYPVSGTEIDFTDSDQTPVVYTVQPGVGAQQTWEVTCIVDMNTANDISSFVIPGQVGTSAFDPSAKTITFHVPYGTDVTGLQPQLTIPDQAVVSPASGEAVDFSDSGTTPVSYTVVAGSGMPQIWSVTCVVDLNPANDIVSYSVDGQIGSSRINTTDHTVTFYLMSGTDVFNLRPTIVVSESAEIVPESGISPTFTNGSALYTVTAQNGARQIWIVSYLIYYIPAQEDTTPKTPDTQQEKLEEAITDAKKTVFVQAATGTASSVGSKSAVLNGIITAGGGDIQTGFRYRAVGASGWSYTGVQALSLKDGQGFSAEVKGLKPNTAYEFEARAANSAGMSEGGILTFTTEKAQAPKVQTLGATAGNLETALITGAVTDDGGDKVKDAGFLWGATPSELSRHSLGAETLLSLELEDLKIGSTLYYQAYAENSGGMTKGELRTFKVPGMIAATLAATEISKDGATLHGRITGDGRIIESGFTISPAVSGSLKATPEEDGSFKVTLKGLKPGTKYYFIAYAKTADIEYSGQVMEFTPQSDFPEVETYEAEDVGRIMASFGGYITKNKGFPILDCGFYWGQDPNPDQKISVTTAEDIRTMEFRLVGLQASTTYYYKAYAENKNGTGFGEVVSFTTADATVPVLTTRSAVFDPDYKQWVLVGSVQDNGGADLAEYGFRLSGNGETWTDLPIGFDILGDYVSRGSRVFGGLDPGTYEIKAYAVNSVGYGEGDVLPIIIPSLPKVKTVLSQDTIDLDKVTLQGTITDTGAEGALCCAAQFKYRKAGEKEWTLAGTVTGGSVMSDFSYKLTGLTPGEKYEFIAEAENSYGSASGDIVTFTMNYGKTPKQAVSYLKGEGKSCSEIIGILNKVYQCSLNDCVQVLCEERYSCVDITAAMKNSVYQAKHRDLAVSLKKAGISGLELAQALLSHYSDPMRTMYGIKVELILTLKEAGFSLTEIMKAFVSLYGYDATGLYNEFFAGYLNYSTQDINASIIEILGFDPLLEFFWARSVNTMNTFSGWGPLWQYLYETAVIMRDLGGMEPAAIGDKLKQFYPQLTVLQLAQSFYFGRFPITQAIDAVTHVYGGDPMTLAGVLNQANYNKEDITRYFIEYLGCSSVQMVQIVTSVLRLDPMPTCASILQEYYGLDAPEAAKVMYAAGWTEKVSDSNGYGLGKLIRTMQTYFDQTSAYELISILKELGVSPSEVAYQVRGMDGWLEAYRVLGYSAADAAVWFKAQYQNYGLHSQLGVTVRSCDEAGYSHIDIALGLRAVYGTDSNTALSYFLANTKKSEKEISDALTIAYGENPILNAIQAMKGKPVKNIASALRYTYNVNDVDAAVDYLLQADFSNAEILQGIVDIYFSIRSGEQFSAYLAYVWKKLPDATFADALNSLILNYGEKPGAGSVIYWLLQFSYDHKAIAQVLAEEYAFPLDETLNAMDKRFGRASQREYLPLVLSAYGLGTASYAEYGMNRGMTAKNNAAQILYVYDTISAEEMASALAKAGYDKFSVVDAILAVYYSGIMSAEAAAAMESILQSSFPDSAGDEVRVLLKNGEVQPVSQAIRLLNTGGYSLEEIAMALKDIYSLSKDQIYTELAGVYLYSANEISAVLQAIYGQSFITIMINSWRAQPWGNAGNIYRELKNAYDITDPVSLVKYMLYAGIPEGDVIEALYYDQREAMVIPLKAVYDITDAVGMGTLLGRFRVPGGYRLYTGDLADKLIEAFPGTTEYQIIKTFQAYGYPSVIETQANGYPVQGQEPYSIEDWLRTWSARGVRDDILAAYLGRNNGGLDLPVHIAAEILKDKGYNVQDAAYWLLQCGYTWEEFYKELVNKYAPTSYPQSYYENNSPSKFIVQYLKEFYDINDIVRGEYGYWGSPYGVLADLISGGYTVDQSIYAILWASDESAETMLIAVVDNSISRANAPGGDPSLRFSAIEAANKVFNISIAVTYDKRSEGIEAADPVSMEDIAKCMVKYGPAAGSFRHFSDWEVLAATESIMEKYVAMTGIELPVREAALATLRLAGASPSDGAAMLAAHKVGLSTVSVIKSVFGLGNDWMEAVKILAGAGYDFVDSIEAVFNNPSYHNIIGVGILSMITSSAIGALSASSSVGTYVSIVKEIAKVGFKIGEGTLTLDDVLKYNPTYSQYKAIMKLKEYIPAP